VQFHGAVHHPRKLWRSLFARVPDPAGTVRVTGRSRRGIEQEGGKFFGVGSPWVIGTVRRRAVGQGSSIFSTNQVGDSFQIDEPIQKISLPAFLLLSISCRHQPRKGMGEST
jgi:hypothetical protein